MTDLETLLVDRLEARAERIAVPPAPLDAVRRAAVVRRRRRPLIGLAAAAAVAVVAVGLSVLDPTTRPEPAPADPVPAGPVVVATRLGIGHLSVERPVPPVRVEPTTVDPAAISSHSWAMEAGRVDGVRVRTSRVERVFGEWRALVWVPTEQVGLVVTSPDHAADVEAVLGTLSVDPAQVAVPEAVAVDGTPVGAAAYLDRLRDLGLEASVSVAGGSGAQRVDAVSPAAGTVVPVGSRVDVVTIDQEPSGRP